MKWNQESLQTIYPFLPEILPEEILDVLTTFETKEKEFVYRRNALRNQYSLGLYLKAANFLGHTRFQLTKIPRLFRLRVAQALDLSEDLVDSIDNDRTEKSRLVALVRKFLPLKEFSASIQCTLEETLRNSIATRESELVPIINNAIQVIRSLNVELPTFEDLEGLACNVLAGADHDLEQGLNDHCGADVLSHLNSMLEVGEEGRTAFDQTKDPIGCASPVTLLQELNRLEKLKLYAVQEKAISHICQRKREVFASIACRLNVQELKQISAPRKHLLLACHVWAKHRRHLDHLVDLYCRIWDHTLVEANQYAQEIQIKYANAQERHQGVLKDLVSVIRINKTEFDLWRGIYNYKNPKDYQLLENELGKVPTWSASYHKKIRDFYSTQRRFLPKWYELMPLSTSTTDMTLVNVAEFLKNHAASNETELPVQEAPLCFLTDDWQSRALKRHRWTKELLNVHKAPYEQAYFGSCVGAFRNGTLNVSGSQAYAPITDLLMEKDLFLSDYVTHMKQLGWPIVPDQFIQEELSGLKGNLKIFDKEYKNVNRTFWITKKGKLGFSRTTKQDDHPRITRLTEQLQAYIPKATIIEVFLDTHNLTGFLDHYSALAGRQNMSDKDRVYQLIATHYAYGCNTGPSQAAQAMGLHKSQIVYMRRRYTGIKQLTRAASALADAFARTPIASLLGDPNVFMTDSMRFRTLKKSLVAREHHRYKNGKSILLFQHVMSNCICLFSKALLCNVSEAIQMLIGALAIQKNGEKLINICDSAGKSDLGLGLGKLLNITIWPRFRSRNLRLWGVSKDDEYTNISHWIAGTIRQDLIQDGWKDMMWVLASIQNGTSHPGLILEQLARMPNHPATLGFKELGKIERTDFLLKYGMDMNTRQFLQKYTSRREHWNKFTRSVFHAFGGMVREKTLEDQDEIFWFLTVVQNAIILWNAHALEQAVSKARKDGISFNDDDLSHVLPTLLDHINFVGEFDLDMDRKLPFSKTAIG